jgi:GxxExxY protein
MGNRQERQDAKMGRFEPPDHLDALARRVIGAAIEVHRHLGPGFNEVVYDEALAVEFGIRNLDFVRQSPFPVQYKGFTVGEGRPDFVVGGSLVVEIKAVAQLLPVHIAQVISYLKARRMTLGLILNFKETTMRRGIKRVVFDPRRTLQAQDCASDVNESQEGYRRLVVSRRNPSVALEPMEEYFDAIA